MLRREPRLVRQGRNGERGLTLVEMLITIAVITVGVIGIAGTLAQTERISTITQDQANLEVAMRQLTDVVRDSSSQGLSYKTCATATGVNSYALPAAPIGLTWKVSTVVLGSTATRKSAGGTVTTSPITACGAAGGDWGVQELTLSVSSANRSLTRTVWKSATW
jgi:prepilin-type N-terminal cleavage/methylation domain-containing protein